MLTILTILLSLGLAGGSTRVTLPKIQPVYVKSGDTLNMTCEQEEGFRVLWLKEDGLTQEYKPIDSNSVTGVLILSWVESHRQYARLLKETVTLSDAGSYKCAVQSGTDMPFAVEVFVVPVEEKPGLVTGDRDTTTIGCVISSVEMVRFSTPIWLKNGMKIKNDPKKYTTNVTYTDNTTELMLTVKNVGEADVGPYQCYMTLNNGNNFTHDVNLYAYPQLNKLGRSKNVVAGSNLELQCKFWGWPTPNVTWSFEDGRPLNWSDTRISEISWNGTLKIDGVVPSDRAVYVCTVSSYVVETMQQTSSRILVRVKGKLAVLWPLLGIALEMIILSIIIYVYERNRARQRAEQERKEAADHQSNSNAQPRHQGRDNVRYRK